MDKKARDSVIKTLKAQIKVLDAKGNRTANGVAGNYPAVAADRLRSIIYNLKNFEREFIDHPAIEFQAKNKVAM